MKTLSSSKSVCRRCRYYAPEGRRGGNCQQLNVAVQGTWEACALALPPFSPTWESFEDIMVWQQKTLATMHEPLASAMPEALSEAFESEVLSSSDESAALPYASELAELSLNGASHNCTTQLLPAAPAQTLGIKALWM